VEKLRHFLGHDVNRALAYLNETLKNLTAYTELSPTATLAASPEREVDQLGGDATPDSTSGGLDAANKGLHP
jgi:hypothetical protein